MIGLKMIEIQFIFNVQNPIILNWSFEEMFEANSEQTNQCSFDLPILMFLEQQQSNTKNMDTSPQQSISQKKKISRRKKNSNTKRRKRKIQKNNQNYLNVGPFSIEEDQKILNLILEHGPRFQIIHSHFNERSQNALKNRYYKFLRYRWDQVLGKEYIHLNHISEESEIDQNINMSIQLENMNLFPEVSNILKKLIINIQQHFF